MSTYKRPWVMPTLILALLALAVPIAGLLLGRGAGALAPIRWVEVSGSFERVTAEQVRAAVTPALRGGFFFLPLDEVRERVLTLSWVESAQVRKRWPDVVEVVLYEFSVLAQLGEQKLIDADGRVFSAEGLSPMGGVPRFELAESQIEEAIVFHRQIRPDLQGLGLDLSTLSISRRGSYQLTLSNGISVMVGNTEQPARWRRLMAVMRPLLSRAEQPLARIDLRYTNGFAVLPYQPEPELAGDPQAAIDTLHELPGAA